MNEYLERNSENMYKVSVIIPVYNAANTVVKGIESVLNQTLDQVQLIVVDDGSTDDSLKIIEQYKERNDVTIYSQSNQGVAKARNAGIGLADGEYLFFLDSDDYMDQDLLSKMYDLAKANQLDLVASNHVEENATLYQGNENKAPTFVATGLQEITEHFFDVFPKSVWAKLFRAEIIKKNNLEFPYGMHLGEDWYFSTQFLKYCEKIGKISDSYYHVVNINMNSLSKRYVPDLGNDVIKQYDLWQEICERFKGLKELYNAEHMDYGVYLMALYADNFYKYDSPQKISESFRLIKAFIKAHPELLAEKQSNPGNKVEKITNLVIHTRNSVLIGCMFWMKEMLKRRKLSRK